MEEMVRNIMLEIDKFNKGDVSYAALEENITEVLILGGSVEHLPDFDWEDDYETI
jgi:hypothetical protein